MSITKKTRSAPRLVPNVAALATEPPQPMGGLIDPRADASGIFIFRFEDAQTEKQKVSPLTRDGKTPVVYAINLKDPASFFIAQNFPMRNKDVLYVANAPAAELQKFLNLVGSVVYPFDVINRLLQ